jgi:hypothetical protein
MYGVYVCTRSAGECVVVLLRIGVLASSDGWSDSMYLCI